MVYKNPLTEPDHPLHPEYQKARNLQDAAHPAQALDIWAELLERCTEGTPEHIEVGRQIAVCNRLTDKPDEAEVWFKRTRNAAVIRFPELAVHIACDHSALLIESGKANEAVALLESLEKDSSKPTSYVLWGYLGRAYGQQSRKERWRANYYLQVSAKCLNKQPGVAAFYLDVLFWLVELWPAWSLRAMVYASRALYEALCQRRWMRALVDLPVTYIGGYKGRNKVRRIVSRFQKK